MRDNRDVEPTLEDLGSPPLPTGPLADAWRGYLAAWYDGRRAQALTTLTGVVDDLAAGPPETRDGFAEWLCRLLFDRSRFWAGQWGGGMACQDGGRRQRPAAPALTAHPLGARIVLPYLLAALPEGGSPQARWLYQFASGQGYRLQPGYRARLLSAIQERFGPDAPLTVLLRHASEDPIAQRMLREVEQRPCV